MGHGKRIVCRSTPRPPLFSYGRSPLQSGTNSTSKGSMLGMESVFLYKRGVMNGIIEKAR
jgi:hypothetical protein